VFGTRDAFDMALNKLTDHISNAPMHPGFSPLQMPGAPEVEIMALRAQKGIPLDTPLFSQLLKMAKALGITAPKMEQTC
jgi:LDH2 family malate/lactate/ureidoglycolate dehydrogenase